MRQRASLRVAPRPPPPAAAAEAAAAAAALGQPHHPCDALHSGNTLRDYVVRVSPLNVVVV